MDDFLAMAAEVLEVPSIGADDDFRAVPMWGSLAAFAMSTMCAQRYGRRLTAADFAAAKTVRDLATAAGVEV